jgi:prophage maintenance system killer protein
VRAIGYPRIDVASSGGSGNKRTAFAVMETFLELNGYTLLLDNEAAYELVIQVAQSDINKEELTAKLSGAIALLQP